MPSPDAALVLDFSSGGVLPPDLMRRLDALAIALRPDFNAMIDRISARYPRNIDWWVSLPAGRNTHNSQLFGKCVQLALAQALAREGRAILVRTDDKAQAQVLRAEDIPVEQVRGRSRWRMALHDVASSLFHALGARRAARATRALARPLPPDAVLLETYVQRDSFGPAGFKGRYYPGLYESLEPAHKARLFHTPIFYRIRDYRSLFRQLRQAPQNFLLREDHLTWRDYLFAFGHWWRAGRLKGQRAEFSGFAIGPLLDAELDKGRFANAALQALLIYRFWRLRSPQGKAVLLDWYEGHDMDHATAAGINWHGHTARHIAMRPLAPDSYLSLTPTAGEIEAQVVAPRWLVVGEDRRHRFAAQFPTLAIGPAPGLRHRALLDAAPAGLRDGPISILVLLSIETDLAQLVAGMIARAGALAPDIRWLVKPHPGMPRQEAERILQGASNIVFLDSAFTDALRQADIVAGLGTNTLIEAAAMGVPMICVSGGNLPTELPFEADSTVWWRAAYDAAELVKAAREAPRAPSVRSPAVMNGLLGPFDPAVLRDILFA